MRTTVYIAFNKKGAARLTKTKPHLAREEIAVGVRIEIPDTAFLAPIIFADLVVPEHAVLVPEVSIEVEEQPV